MNAIELRKYFSKIYCQDNEIFSGDKSGNGDQNLEFMLRERVAREVNEDYFFLISKSHSIEVMDNEVNLFLNSLPINACILDVGGVLGLALEGFAKCTPRRNCSYFGF